MKKIFLLFTVSFFVSSLIAADYYWSGNVSTNPRISIVGNWIGATTAPASGDNLYFNNTTGGHRVYVNYGTAGSWFGDIITYNGADSIYMYGDTLSVYKLENNSDPRPFTVANQLRNRSGSDIQINPISTGELRLTALTLRVSCDNTASRSVIINGNGILKMRNVISETNTASGLYNVSLIINDNPSVTLTGAQKYSGSTVVNGGILNIGVANALPIGPTSGVINFAGGTPVVNFNNFSIGSTTNYAGELDFDVNTTLNLGTSGSRYFKASDTQVWDAGEIVINNWVRNTAGSGVAKIFIGNNGTGLTPAQLAKIRFTGYSGPAMLLSTGELVPGCSSAMVLKTAPESSAQGVIVNTQMSPIVYSLGGSADVTVTGLPAGVTYSLKNNTDTLIISGTPTATGNFTYVVNTPTACKSMNGTIYVTESSASYFRTRARGYWGVPTVWESSTDSITWTLANTFPTSNAKSILISHTVTRNLDLTLFPSSSNYYIHIAPTGRITATLNESTGLNVRGNIFNEGTLVISGTTTKSLVVNDLVNNGTLTLSSGALTPDLIIYGNFTQNGTFTPGAQGVQFAGNGVQYIDGTVTPINFTYLRLLKSGGEVIAKKAVNLNGSTSAKYPAALRISNTIFNIQDVTATVATPTAYSTVNCVNGGVFRTNKNSKLVVLGRYVAASQPVYGNIDFETNSIIGTLRLDRLNGDILNTSSFTVTDSLNIRNGWFHSNANITLDSMAVGVMASLSTKNPKLTVNNLIFTKTELNSAQFYRNGKSLTIDGIIRTKVFFDRTNKWHFIAFPYNVTNVYKPNSNDIAVRGSDFSIAQYNATKRAAGISGWETSYDNLMQAGKGYIINEITDNGFLYFDGTVTGTDPMFSNNVSRTLTYTPTTTPGDVNNYNAGWNFIAHPLSLIATPSLANAQFAYNYNPAIDAYKLWYGAQNPAYTMSSGGIQPMEACFIKLPSTAVTVMWGVTQPLGLRQFTKAATEPVIEFTLHSNNIQYPTYVRLKSDATANFDELYDAPYSAPMYSTTPRAYTFAGSYMIALNSAPENTEIPVGIRLPKKDSYKFTWTVPAEIPQVTLTDKLTGNVTDMTLADNYTFATAAAGDFNTRFIITLGKKIPTSVSKTQSGYSIYGVGRKITVEHLDMPSIIQIMDISGRTILKQNAVETKTSFELPAQGVYLVKISNQKGEDTTKVILK